MGTKYGIDVSKHNGKIDWAKVKGSGKVDFAIIRTGFGVESSKQIDSCFEYNYSECKKYGIPVGAYHYSYATTVNQAKQEADFCLKLLKGKKFEYPIFYDMEEKTQVALSKLTCSGIAETFCTALESEGYWAGIYSFDSFFNSNLSPDIPARYTAWVARVPNNDNGSSITTPACVSQGLTAIHQYSWKGKIAGITGDVDLNISYKDFATLIPAVKKNGYGQSGDKTYTVEAEKRGLNQSQSNTLKSTLSDLGMTVKIVEE